MVSPHPETGKAEMPRDTQELERRAGATSISHPVGEPLFPSDLLAENSAAFTTEETKSQHSHHKIQILQDSFPWVCVFTDAQSPDSPPLLPSNSQNPKSAPAASPSLCDCAGMRHHLDSFSCRASRSSRAPACCQPSSYSGPSLLYMRPGETQQGHPSANVPTADSGLCCWPRPCHYMCVCSWSLQVCVPLALATTTTASPGP